MSFRQTFAAASKRLATGGRSPGGAPPPGGPQGVFDLNGSPVTGLAIDPTSVEVDGGIATIRTSAPGELGELLQALTGAAGLIIQDIFIGESIPAHYTLADSWPSSMPGTSYISLTAAGAAAHFNIVRDPVSGRKGISDSTGLLDRALVSTNYAPRAVVMVYRSLGTTSNVSIPIAISGGVYPFMQTAYVQTWDETVSSGTPTHYRDGYYLGSQHTRELSVWCGTCAGNSTASLKVGGFDGYGMSMLGEIYAVIPLSAVPNETQLNAINAALAKYYRTQRKRLVVLDGHSIAIGYYAGTPSQAGNSFDYWSRLDIPACGIRNIASSGRTLAQIQAAMAASFAGLDLRGWRDMVYLLDGDVNSYNNAVTGAQVAQANWDIAAVAIAAGMRPIICSCMPSVGVLDVTEEAQRVAGNALKLAGYASHGVEGYIDLAATTGFNDSTSAYFAADNLHLSIPGYRAYANLKRAAIEALA